MSWKLTRELFARMLTEEWRMHTTLFGGRRFAAFPVFICLITAGTVWGLAQTTADFTTVFAGLHVLVFLFGLHTGSIGFVGRDAVRNLIGDVTLIIYSARTLPVSKHRLLAVFLLKDVVYYSLLFLLPMVVAFAVLSGSVSGVVASLPFLWLSVTGTFLLGAVITIAIIGLSTRGTPGNVVFILVAGAAVLLWLNGGLDLATFTPYAVFASPSIQSFLTGFAAIPVIAVGGIVTYDFSNSSGERTADGQFRRIVDLVPADEDTLVAKSLLDLSRSSGGIGKVFFSGGIIFAVSVALIRLVSGFFNITPSTPVAIGGMLGLTAFTSYNWLTQFDDLSDYEAYPVEVADVFRAKFYAFLVTGVPAGLVLYGISLAVFGGSVGEAVTGGVLTVGLQLYLFGLTARLAGLSPNEFLFDTVLFAAFSAAVAVVLVPVLIAGLVLGSLGAGVLVGLGVWGVVAGMVGVWLFGTASPRASHQ